MKDKEIKGAIFPYKDFVEQGFDFNVYEYKATIIISDMEGERVLNNAIVIDDKGIVVNDDKTYVFVIDLKGNKNLKIIKIDETKIN